MRRPFLALVAWSLGSSLVAADLTVRTHEGGVRDGKPWGETYTESFSSQGLRIDVQSDGAPSPYMYFLFLRNPDRLFIVQGASATAVDRALLEALEAKFGVPPRPKERLTSIGSSHSVNGFSCTGFYLKRAGVPTRYACLASPESLGLPVAFVEAARDLTDMMVRVMNATQAAASAKEAKKKAAPEALFNFYGLSEGYPVRLWESKKGEVTWENQLLSVIPGPVSPSLFKAPAASR